MDRIVTRYQSPSHPFFLPTVIFIYFFQARLSVAHIQYQTICCLLFWSLSPYLSLSSASLPQWKKAGSSHHKSLIIPPPPPKGWEDLILCWCSRDNYVLQNVHITQLKPVMCLSLLNFSTDIEIQIMCWKTVAVSKGLGCMANNIFGSGEKRGIENRKKREEKRGEVNWEKSKEKRGDTRQSFKEPLIRRQSNKESQAYYLCL